MFDTLTATGGVQVQSAELRRKDGSRLIATITWRAVDVAGKWVMVGVLT